MRAYKRIWYGCILAGLVWTIGAARGASAMAGTKATGSADEAPAQVARALFPAPPSGPGGEWRVNQWGKNSEGKQGNVTVKPTTDPLGNPAIQVNTQNAGTYNIISPAPADGAWRDHAYQAIALWVRGDGSTSKVRLKLRTDAKDGSDRKLGYSASVSLARTDWRRVVLTGFWHRKGTPPLDLSRLTQVYVSGSGSHQFTVGGLTLLGGRREVPLKPLNLPTATGSPLSAAPTIDGKLDDPVWATAQRIDGLQTYHNNAGLEGKARYPTTIQIGYHGHMLYIGARLDGTPANSVAPAQVQFDTPVWTDPSFEIFLDPGRTQQHAYQLAVNPLGTRLDIGNRSRTWNGQWTSAVRRTDKGWSVELAIDVSQWKQWWHPGAVWGLNFARNVLTTDKTDSERSAWSQGRSTPISGFGNLIIGPAPERRQAEVESAELRFLREGEYGLRVLVKRDGSPASPLLLEGRVLAPAKADATEPAASFSTPIQFGQAEMAAVGVPVSVNVKRDGDYTLVLTVRDKAGRVHGLQTYQFSIVRPVKVDPAAVVLRPVPQVWQPASGRWLMPPTLQLAVEGRGDAYPATLLGEKLAARYGVKIAARAATPAPRADIALTYVDPGKIRSAEGFILDVTPERIHLKASTGRGMYYGVRALLQLIHESSRTGGPARAEAVHCEDWPTVAQRIMYSSLASFYQVPVSVKTYKDFIYNEVAGNRYNLLVMYFRSSLAFESHPEIVHRKTALTKDQVREILVFARRNYVDVAPANEGPGHLGALLGHRPELRYAGAKQLLDMRNPKAIQFLKDLDMELIDLFKPFGATHFHMMGDEVRWPPTQDAKETAARKERLLKFWIERGKWVRSRGLRPIIYDDMLSPKWNGGAPYHTAKILPELPRDFIMAEWTDGPLGNPASRYRELGFETIWRVLTNFAPVKAARAVQWQSKWDGMGIGLTCYWPWSNFTHIDSKRQVSYSVGIHIGGQVAWNPKPAAMGGSRMVMALGPHWVATMEVPAWGVRSMAYQPVPMRPAASARKSLVPQPSTPNDGPLIVGTTPFQFNPAARRSVGPGERAAPVEINQTIRGLVFLQTAATAGRKATRTLEQWFFKHNTSQYGMDIAHYLVRYADGVELKAPVTLGWNVHLWNCDYMERILPGVSGYWTQKAAGPDDSDLTLFALPWVNPRPEVPIASVTLQGDKPPARTVLFGITAVVEGRSPTTGP